MGEISQRQRHVIAVLSITSIIIVGALACSSPIPSHFTIRTGQSATATFTVTPVPPTATATVTATTTPATLPTTTVASAATFTPTPSATRLLPRDYTRTPTLTTTPTPRLPQGEVYYDDENGFALVLPEDWVAGKSGDGTAMAISDVVWQSDAPNDPFLILIVGAKDEILDGTLATARTADDVLLIAGGNLGQDWETKVTAVSDSSFKDFPAATSVLQDANPERHPQLKGRAIALLLDDRAAMIWTLAPVDQWEEFQPTLEGILNSITFTKPTQSPVPKTPTKESGPTATLVPRTPTPAVSPTIKRPPAVPTPTAPSRAFSYGAPEDFYANEWENYSILVPKDWRVYIEEGTLTIAPSVDDFSLEVIRDPMVEVTVGSLSTLWDGAAAGATSPAPLLDVATRVQADRGIHVVSGPTPLQVAGNPALTVELAGQGLAGQLTSIYLGDNRAALVGVLAPEDQWSSFAPVFREMTESLRFTLD